MSDRQEQQLTLWEYIAPRYKIKQPVILLEMFAGIGAQHKALSILGIEIDKEKSKICEWAYNSYCGYNAIHIKDFNDYSINKTKEEMVQRISGTSTNYNEPLTMDQLNKKSIEWIRNAYNNCVATHNLVNIMETKGSDLGKLPTTQTSILTYSFPCQDLSLAGKRQGMATSQADGGTRSGLLWEIERILRERERESSTLPSILLMENVPEVVGVNNINAFKKWEQKLRELGYSNFVEILNGKDYGIPQNRRRCFMISILGDYSYDFPCKVKLKYKLKDMLDKDVDEKYYLDDNTIERISNWKSYENPLEQAIDIERERERVMPTLTARGAGEEHSGMKLIKIGNYGNGHHAKDVFDTNGSAPTITTGNHGLGQAIAEIDKLTGGGLMIKENNKQGYKVAQDGDGIDISTRMHHHRGNVQKNSCQTLTTQGGDNVGVVVKNEQKTKKVD